MNRKHDISRRSALRTGAAAMGGLLLGQRSVPGAAQKENRPPNIVVIFTDDQGYADVSYSPHSGPGVITPNIDRIARDGVVFTQGYVTGAMCLPSRVGMLTGRYQQRYGVHWADPPTRPMRLIPDYLNQAGYASTALGKWHLPVDVSAEGNPTEMGFDEFYGFNHGGRNYFDLSNTMIDFAPMYRGKEKLEDETGYLTHRLTDEAVDFIKRHRDDPFFLYLPYNAVHTPLQAHIEHVEAHHKYTKDPARKILLTMIDYLDQGVGKILDTLETEGLYEDTLIFFLTDNGGSEVATHADNGPLRGQKLQHFEGGVRVPFAVSWPAGIQGGRTLDAPVSALDILPTCLAAAGLPQPDAPELDGVNLLPLLNGEEAVPERDLYWWWATGPFPGGWAMRSGDWKLVQLPGEEPPPAMLFDLAADPYEKNDLAEQRPEVVRELVRKFEQWSAQADQDAGLSR